MSSKKVGVITFHNYDNYGAVLQSYALQECIKRYGAQTEIIDYNCKYITNPFQLKRLKNKGFFNYIYGAVGYICYLPRRRKCNKFRRMMKYSEPVNKENIGSLNGKYDVFITGSDQIWDYHLTDFDRTYFLDFVTQGKKCSYAASIGEHLPPEKYQKEYSELLGSFDRILVRESYGADVVEQLTGRRPDCTCDPTLLLSGEEWEQLIEKTSEKQEDYILVYQLGVNPSFVKFVKRLKKKMKLPVKYIPFPLVGILGCSTNLTAGPEEWLKLFRNAKYIVTDSFHGAVFSVLFHKPFFVRVDGHHVNKRVEELLTHLNMTDRIISESLTDEMLSAEVDYSYADEILQSMRKDSLNKISEIIA